MAGGRPRHRVYDSPETLEDSCNAYFEWCSNNPWMRSELIRGGDLAGKIIEVPIQRPYTVIALCFHIGVATKTWYNYEKDPEFLHITTHVHEKIRNQKLEGAIVGIFNSNIIARDLGLADNQNVDIKTEGDLFKPLGPKPME